MDVFIGQISLLPWDWAPSGWAKCDGSMLPIQGNEALFSLIGTSFGGDGRTEFALPELRDERARNGGTLAYYIALQGIFPSRT